MLQCRETRTNGQATPWSHRHQPSDAPLFAVRIVDNDTNTYEQVMDIVMRAAGLSVQQAYWVAWTVDHEGSCVACLAPEPDAHRIAKLIGTIGIEVHVEPYTPPTSTLN